MKCQPRSSSNDVHIQRSAGQDLLLRAKELIAAAIPFRRASVSSNDALAHHFGFRPARAIATPWDRDRFVPGPRASIMTVTLLGPLGCDACDAL